MKVLEGLLYSESHEWVKLEGEKAKVGISDYAQQEMGDIVFVNLPQVGDQVSAGEILCDFESVKAVSDIYSPIGGKIVTANEALDEAPQLINEDCYAAWLCEMEEIQDADKLMDAAAYRKYLEEVK